MTRPSAKIDPSLDDAKKAKAKDDLDKVLQVKNDAAVDKASEVTGRFNDQIKAYNAAHKTELITTARRPQIASMNTPAPAQTDSHPAGLLVPAQADRLISENLACLPIESLPLVQCAGAVLRENVYAERDQPPFDRVAMDGIALDSAAAREGRRSLPSRPSRPPAIRR